MTEASSGRYGLGRIGVLVPIAYMGGIYWLSSLPGVPGLDTSPAGLIILATPPALQNLLHIPLFGLLAWLWQWSLRAWSLRTTLVHGTALLLTVAFGVLDEFHQLQVPGRHASIGDMGLNALGAVVVLWFVRRSGTRS